VGVRTGRIVAVGALCVGLLAGCTGDGGGDGDEPVALPDDVAERTDTATYVAPGGAFEVDVPSDWGFTETSVWVTARPDGAEDMPVVYIEEVPVGEEVIDLDAYIDETFGDSPVPVDVEVVDVPGASDARLVEPQFEDGGRALLIAIDATGEDAVVVDVLWEEDDLDVEEARAIATSLRFTTSDTADT
jgi:hypothetical protein